MELPPINDVLRALWRGERALGMSPLLAAKIAVDEAVCTLRRVRMRWLDAEWERIAGETAAAAELFAARGWHDAPHAYHQTPPPLRRATLRRSRSLGLEFQHLRFASGYAPHAGEPGRQRWLSYRANRTAHAWMLRHPDGPRRWIVCVHGYGMGAPLMDLAAFQVPWLYHELGLNVMIPVLPLHGPRSTGWSGDGFFSGDCLDTLHAEAQAIWDLRRLLGWIRAQDAPAIGVYGLSLGGYTAALLGGLEDDLACIIAGIPPSDFVALGRHHMPAALLRAAEALGLDWEIVDRIFRVVSPLAMPPRIPRERRFLFAGLADRIVPPSQVRALSAHWEHPQTIWYAGSHFSCHWEPEVRALLRETLQRTLCSVPGSGVRSPSRAVGPARAHGGAHARAA